MVCPPQWQPMSRVLIIHGEREGSLGYLDSAALLCSAFQVSPIVLTVARTDSRRERAMQQAEGTIAQRRLSAYFDFAAGYDLRKVVASIAHWRRCSHVFLARRRAIPWWRWLRGDMLQRLLALSNTLTFLALPEPGLRSGKAEEPSHMAQAQLQTS